MFTYKIINNNRWEQVFIRIYFMKKLIFSFEVANYGGVPEGKNLKDNRKLAEDIMEDLYL